MERSQFRKSLLAALCWTLGLWIWGGAATPTHAASSPQLKAALVSIKALYGNQQWSNVVSQAQQAIQSPNASNFTNQYALLHVYLGAAFFQQKQKPLAYYAFEKALIWQPASTLPAGSSQGMQRLLASARKRLAKRGLGQVAKTAATPTNKPAPSAKGGAHIGWILGWVSVAVAGAAIGMASVAGGNAYINAQESANLLREARQNKYSQTLMDPIVTSVHERAVTYGTIANVGYIVAGTAAAGATGFFLWAFFASKKKGPAKAALPQPHSSVQHSSIHLQFQ